MENKFSITQRLQLVKPQTQIFLYIFVDDDLQFHGVYTLLYMPDSLKTSMAKAQRLPWLAAGTAVLIVTGCGLDLDALMHKNTPPPMHPAQQSKEQITIATMTPMLKNIQGVLKGILLNAVQET